jgi:trimethylamine--corrinoid protein Co-methyltransferase
MLLPAFSSTADGPLFALALVPISGRKMMSVPDHTTMTFSPLSPEHVEKLHLATLDILERTGVAVQNPEGRALLLDNGARPGKGDVVYIPSWMVKRAIAAAPEKVVLHDRQGRRSVFLEDGRVFFGTGSDTPNTIDPYTRKRRRTVKADTAKFALLCDALPNMNFIMSMAVAEDVPSADSFVHEFEAMVTSSSKPIVFTASDNRDMQAIYKMATVVAGDEESLRQRPFLLHYSEPITPLIHSQVGTEKLLFCAEKGIPVVYVSGCTSGGTMPVTLAGAITVANAECLSGLVMSQLKSPGAPFVYGANVGTIDMRTSQYAYASPEHSLTNSIFAAMAHYYKLPVWGLAGASDSKVLDGQAASEAMFSIFAALLSGANLVHDVGYIENGLTSSMEMVLFSDEAVAMCRRFLAGVTLDDNSLAADLIDSVGHGGQFLDSVHTAENFRAQHWLTRFMDHRHYTGWTESGSLDLYERLNAAVKNILETHKPEPLPADKRRELARILKARKG